MTKEKCGIPGYWTEHELAHHLGKSWRTVRRWRREGTGPPYVKCGITTVYRIEAVQTWLREQEITA